MNELPIEAVKYLTKLQIKENIKIVYLTKYGSHLYGTDTPNSDTDIKGLFIYDPKDSWYDRKKDHYTFTTGGNDSSNNVDDIDIELYSIQKFLTLVRKGETGAIDLLFSTMREDTQIVLNEDVHKWTASLLSSQSKNLITKKIHAFQGYCVSQSKKYGAKGSRYREVLEIANLLNQHVEERGIECLDSPTIHFYLDKKIELENFKYCCFVHKEGQWFYSVLGKLYSENIKLGQFEKHLNRIMDDYGERAKRAVDNVDYKALSHAFRVIEEVQEILTKGKIEFPLKSAIFLKEIKAREFNVGFLISELDLQLERTQKLVEESNLPEKIEEGIVENILEMFYNRFFKNK